MRSLLPQHRFLWTLLAMCKNSCRLTFSENRPSVLSQLTAAIRGHDEGAGWPKDLADKGQRANVSIGGGT